VRRCEARCGANGAEVLNVWKNKSARPIFYSFHLYIIIRDRFSVQTCAHSLQSLFEAVAFPSPDWHRAVSYAEVSSGSQGLYTVKTDNIVCISNQSPKDSYVTSIC